MLSNLESSIKDIHWKVQDSTSDSVLFYWIGPREIDEQKFFELIHSADYKLLIVNKKLSGLPSNSQVKENENFFIEQKKWLDLLYPLPAIEIFAITGTNGKTTTADLILQLGHMRKKIGFSIGTLGVKTEKGIEEEFGLTTPNYLQLRKYLNYYGKSRDFCVLEASSHALDQNRFFDLRFDQAGWTSFSQDHLDYHATMDSYFKAKLKLFDFLKLGGKLWAPADDERLSAEINKVRHSSSNKRNFEKLPLFFSVDYNRRNLEVALNILEAQYGSSSLYDFSKLQSPEGRFFIREFSQRLYIVDFAHTPDALENICRGVRENYPDRKLKVLFGCGGDRDRSKRPLMANAALKFANYLYVTSDNPRSEDPEKIIDDIVDGLKSSNWERHSDRKWMIQKAIQELQPQEILIMAGKGHENYILRNGIKEPHSDQEEAEKKIKELNL